MITAGIIGVTLAFLSLPLLVAIQPTGTVRLALWAAVVIGAAATAVSVFTMVWWTIRYRR